MTGTEDVVDRDRSSRKERQSHHALTQSKRCLSAADEKEEYVFRKVSECH